MLTNYKGIAANLPSFQYGFRLETVYYREKFVPYQGQTVLYYEFLMDDVNAIHVVPDGCTDVIFCCDPLRPHSLLCGTILQGENFNFYAGATYFGIRLSPIQSLQIRPTTFRDLIDKQLPLEEIMKGIDNICENIALKTTFHERISYLEHSFLPLLLTSDQSSQMFQYCIQQIYRSKGLFSVEQLATDLGFSSRYLRKKFEETLGLSPKQYSRIIRFQNTLSFILNQKNLNVANEHGYYDQSHLIKDFKFFSLLTPMQISELLKQTTDHTMHLVGSRALYD
ncbi:helix-turn-helix domain-containing protein [Brevibacillus daliensis]|uniref:helix-turn-helix domain-containing protein n=1 Tax=Brevibacillus daliensis TaxID=2892995 RepID=UPI001E552F51|nr:helix-turn-helix domain-containing protein [Brevibacillus daliensis]